MTETVILPIAASSSPASLPASSLIIPSRNRPELLLAAVRSILQGDDIPTELIIIDQSDAPSTALATLTTDRACKIRYLWTKSVGASRARNAGIAAAQHDILVFTDDDVTVTSTWFGALIRALLCAGPRAVVTGRVLAAMAQTPGGFAPSTKADENHVVYVGRIGEDVLFSNNAAMFRSAIKEVGDFDVRLGPGGPFSTAEDNDLGFRLLEAGYRINYVPEAVLYHRPWRNERDYLPLRWSYGYGQGAYFAKHLSLRDRYMLWRMVRHIKNHLLGFVRRVWGQRHLACGDAVYVFAVLCGAAKWLLTQRRTL
jgi:GT2 family glycosyltransferase